MSVLPIRPKTLIVRIKRYEHRNWFSKARVWRWQQRLRVGLCKLDNHRRKEVTTGKEVRVRAETKWVWAGWSELGWIWPRLVCIDRGWCTSVRDGSHLGVAVPSSVVLGSPNLMVSWREGGRKRERKKEKGKTRGGLTVVGSEPSKLNINRSLLLLTLSCPDPKRSTRGKHHVPLDGS